MSKRILSLLFALALALPTLLASCDAPQSAFTDDGKVKIAATLFPQYDFARVIGADRVQIIKLLPAGAESHTFEPTAADLVSLNDADLFLYTGPDMEPWAKTVLSTLESPPLALDLTAAIGLSVSPGHDHADHATPQTDPHIWTSPKNAIAMVKAIRDTLIALDPDGKAVYEANTDAYLTELTALNADLRTVANEKRRDTLVFAGRFAFAHLCADYGFSFLSPYRGCDVEAEPSAADIATVIDFVKQNQIPIVFREELVSPTSVATITNETGAALLLLHSCHNVAKEEIASTSYLSLMRQNIAVIRRALCE